MSAVDHIKKNRVRVTILKGYLVSFGCGFGRHNIKNKIWKYGQS